MNFDCLQVVVRLLCRWIVPLYIAFNVVSSWGLAEREANRIDPKLNDEQTLALKRALSTAWLAGVVLALIVLSAIFEFAQHGLQKKDVSFWPTAGAGAAGLLAGCAQIWLAHAKATGASTRAYFRNTPVQQKRWLSAAVAGWVALSLTCGVLYYNSGTFVQALIASAFACMLCGYLVGQFLF